MAGHRVPTNLPDHPTHEHNLNPTLRYNGFPRSPSPSLINLPPYQQRLPAPSSTSRLQPRHQASFDNLYIFITTLIVVHDTAISYSSIGKENSKLNSLPSFSPSLNAFISVNNTFILGIYFFLAGRTAQEILSRSAGPQLRIVFLYSRARALLAPAFAYMLFAEPLTRAILVCFKSSVPRKEWTSSIPWLPSSYIQAIGGPASYLAVVMILDALAVLLVSSDHSIGQFALPLRRKGPIVAIVWATVALSTFFVRFFYPANQSVSPLNIQLSHLPKYILAYVWGHLSIRVQDPFALAIIPPQNRNFAIPCLALLFSTMFSHLALAELLALAAHPIELRPLDKNSILAVTNKLAGGLGIPAFLYASWEVLSFGSISAALMAMFLEHGDEPFRIRAFGMNLEVVKYAYATFLVHQPISLGIQLAVEALNWHLDPMRGGPSLCARLGPGWMTTYIGAANVVVSWVVAGAAVKYVGFIERTL